MIKYLLIFILALINILGVMSTEDCFIQWTQLEIFVLAMIIYVYNILLPKKELGKIMITLSLYYGIIFFSDSFINYLSMTYVITEIILVFSYIVYILAIFDKNAIKCNNKKGIVKLR